MITNICLLLEALSILYCVHCLYGERFRFDIATTSYLAIYMIIMSFINYYCIPQIYTLIVYPIMFLYCGIRFGFRLKLIIINNILWLVVIGGVQTAVSWIYGIIFNVHHFTNIDLLAINSEIFIIAILFFPRCRLKKLSGYLQDKERILVIALIISVIISVFCVFDYKEKGQINLDQSTLLFASLVLIGILAYQLSKYKIKAKEIEAELKMNKLYAVSFQKLIDGIRLKQHEFDNHISAILNQHYMYDTYEQLVEVQKDYCNVIVKENKYNKLLLKGNSIVIGFLYGKFVEIDKLGIELTYKVSIDKLEIGVPVHKLVELIGNLIDNAIDALKTQESKGGLHVEVIEVDGEVMIKIRNESEFIKYEDIKDFFAKGYSKKGKTRGLGLFNVNNICDEYMLYITCKNENINGKNWISFCVSNKKEIA